MRFQILGTGSALPEKILTNDDLAAIVETNDEWIMTRVGVRQRHIAVHETTADLAYTAAVRAMEMSGLTPADIDLIICGTITPDRICPTVAGEVQARLGAVCPAFDINSACSGFLFALDTAAGFFAKGGIRNAIVIGAERISKIIDWTDRSTCVIFGDGAGAAVLGACEENRYLCSELVTKGGDSVIKIPAYAGTSIFTDTGDTDKPVIFMEGQETFKFAVNALTGHVRSMCEKLGIEVTDIDHVVPHQANIRIISMAARKLGLPMDKFTIDIDHVGNTAAASVPIALDEANRAGKLKKDALVAMTAFGGGLSSAGCVIRW
ncbi:MAG: ketoacyl-ACP synthase III [Clostridia bacterium]|nr:ketoacyl-ACP synthase III [Clostridia bacterium]